MRRALKWVAATLVVASTASAEPRYSRDLDRSTLDRAKIELRDLAKREGIEGETADLLLKLDVFATSNDTGCPGVDVDVINATGRTVWNVEVKIDQKEGASDRTDRIHLPYLLPNTKARVQVSCLQDYKSRYSYSGGGGISLSYLAQGAKDIDEALPKMLEQKVDYTNIGATLSPSPAERGNLLEAALEMDDPDVAKELVQAIARTGVGKKELGEAIANNGTGAIADEVVNALAKLPAAQQAQLARTLLASEVALRWKDKLGPMIESKLCVGNRADVVGLWIQAQDPEGIPVEEFRTRISAKCKPTKADGPGITAALEKEPARAGGVLDAVDDDLFASAVAAWGRVKPPAVPSSLMAYLREGQNVARFEAAVKSVAPMHEAEAIEAVLETPDGAAAARKAEWITATYAKLPPGSIDLAVTNATRTLVTGRAKAPVMRDVIQALAKLSPKAAEDVMVTQASSSSKVFDAEKLQAAGLDMGEFLAFNATLGDCTATVELFTACMEKIAAYKDKTGAGALVKQAQNAAKPEFLTSVRELLTGVRDPESLIPVSAAFSAAGFDAGFIADRACRDAEDAVRWDNDPTASLELASKITPGAPCITAVQDKQAGKRRKAWIMGIVGILCLLVPLPLGIVFMKRKWKKTLGSLPVETKEEGPSGAKLDDRLGPGGIGRQLVGAVAEGNRELSGTPIGRALAHVDEPILNAVSSTVRRAVKTADAATLIVRKQSVAIYVVALPVRHPRPQITQRYLSAPWPDHLASIQRAANMPILAMIVLCGPDAAEASLLLGYSDGAQVSDPEAMLDAKEARDRGANKFRSIMTLAATPAAPATPDSAKAA